MHVHCIASIAAFTSFVKPPAISLAYISPRHAWLYCVVKTCMGRINYATMVLLLNFYIALTHLTAYKVSTYICHIVYQFCLH